MLGESRAVVALNPALAALGISRAQTFVKGYWNRPRGLVTPPKSGAHRSGR